MVEKIEEIEKKVASYTEFFDRLVNLVPPQFYFPADVDPNAWRSRFRTAPERAAQKKKHRLTERLRKRGKYDPLLESSGADTVLGRQRLGLTRWDPSQGNTGRDRNHGSADTASADGDDDADPSDDASRDAEGTADGGTAAADVSGDIRGVISGDGGGGGGLRERLQARLEALKVKRVGQGKKRKRDRDAGGGGAAGADAGSKMAKKKRKGGDDEGDKGDKGGKQGKGDKGDKGGKEGLDLKFSKFDFTPSSGSKTLLRREEKLRAGSGGRAHGSSSTLNRAAAKGHGITQGARKVSKAEAQLAEAEAKQDRLAKLRAEGDSRAIAEIELGDAKARAAGEKIRDDPKLLRKSLKRENKARTKSAKAWKARAAGVEKRMAERQDKRKENLKNRRGAGAGGKKRAGFEGKKKQFLNKKKGGGGGGGKK